MNSNNVLTERPGRQIIGARRLRRFNARKTERSWNCRTVSVERTLKRRERRAPIEAVLLAVAIGFFAGTFANAEDFSEKGRAIFNKNRTSVVTVQLVLKTRFSMSGGPGQSSETRQDVTGTVLDSSGLIVLSLTATDPALLMQAMSGGEDDSKFKVETELTDAKILLDDGTEVPAQIVLRDKDLDLAFLRPKAKLASPMTALDFSSPGKAEVLDQVITLNRLGKAAGRAYAASVERIAAIVSKPRLFYVPDSSRTTTGLGSPAFTIEGKPLGILVMRATKGKGGGMGMFGGQGENVTGIFVTADDVMKAAKQAPAQAAEEKPKETGNQDNK